jgi:hypothetical protein
MLTFDSQQQQQRQQLQQQGGGIRGGYVPVFHSSVPKQISSSSNVVLNFQSTNKKY